jgi:predicted methyltransferase
MNPLILSITAAMLWLMPVKANAQTAIEAAIAHPDRPASDRDIDASRKPAEILKFAGLAPGAIVVELGAGGGYTTELAARVVGDDGRVYGQALQPNRVRGNRLPNVVALEPHLLYDLGDTLGQAGLENGQADVVLVFFALHDMYLNSRINKPRLYRTLSDSLRPGGLLVILDNAARPDSGIDDTRRLHRIGEQFVIRELQQAGFELDGTSNALRNPDDDPGKPWNSFLSPVERGFQDRFALRFRKPDAG